MLSDFPVGLIPGHLGLRAPQRQPDRAAQPAHEATAPPPLPAPAASAAPAPVPPAAEPAGNEPRAEGIAPTADVIADAPSPARECEPADNEPAPSAPAPSRPAAPKTPASPPAPALPSPRRRVRRSRWREIGECLELFRICRRMRCRHAQRCCGKPEPCLRAGLEQAPEAIQEFARELMSAQEEGLSFADAFEDAADHHDNYFCWLGGLQAAQRR